MEYDAWAADELVGLGEFASLLPLDGSVGGSRTPQQHAARLRMRKRRDEDFPTPRSVSGRTAMFRLGDLIDWCQDPVVLDPRWLVERAAQALGREQGVEKAGRYLTGVIAEVWSRQPAPRTRRSKRLAAVYEALRSSLPVPTDAARRATDAVAAALAAGCAARELIDLVLETVSPSMSVETTATPDSLAALLTAVAGPPPGERVYDPAIGEASLALAAARLAGGPIDLVGCENDPRAWRIATARLAVHGIAADLGDGPANVLRNEAPNVEADLVLLDPPLEGKDQSSWVNVALRNLAQGGRAVLALPARTLEPGSWIWSLLPPAAVETVVVAPDRLRTDTGEALSIWVLAPDRTDDRILLIDAGPSGHWSGSRKTIDPDDIGVIGEQVTAWRTSGRAPSPDSNARTLTRADLDAAGGDLRPERWIRRDDLATETDRAVHLARELRDLVNGPLKERTTEEHRRALRRLVKSLENTTTTTANE